MGSRFLTTHNIVLHTIFAKNLETSVEKPDSYRQEQGQESHVSQKTTI